MKVENMYKLYEALKKIDKKVDWADVIQLSNDEENILTNAFVDKNPNAYTLYQFYLYTHRDEGLCEEDFKHLQLDDVIKGVVAREILDASTEEMGGNIFKFFDQIPHSFQTEEEFFAYLNSMPKTLELPNYYADDMEAVLAGYDEDRVEIIQGIAQYYDEGTHLFQISTYCSEAFNLSSQAMIKLLRFLSLGYYPKNSIEFMFKWDKALQEKDEHNGNIFAAEELLLDAAYARIPSLPRIFTSDDFEQYPDIINTVRNMLEHANFDLLGCYTVTDIQNSLDKKLFRQKINEVLNLKNKTVLSLFQSLCGGDYLDRLLNSKLSQEEKSEQLDFIIQRFQLEETSDIFTKLLLKLPIDICRMIPEDIERDKLVTIHENIWLYQDRSLFDVKQEETYDLFQKLFALTSETNKKFVTLLNFTSFLSDPKKDEILALLLSKENESSFDYIFNQYKAQEEVYKQKKQKENVKKENDEFQVELAKVVELLDLGYDMSVVLDGFEDGENITAKTLVRSMKYKESC